MDPSEMTPVQSGQLQSIGFKDDALFVLFPRGAMYKYEGEKVKAHYDGMLAAHGAKQSVGSYFNTHVRNCPHTKYTRL